MKHENLDELGPVLPLGVCGACLESFHARTLKTADGGRIVGGLCPHNRTAAILREFPDGSVSPWRMWTPATEQEVVDRMWSVAGVVAGLRAERLSKSN